MRSNSPAAIHSRRATHDPAHATTRSKPRYAARFPALMPPVGMNPIERYGAAIAWRSGSPPIASAGKNLSTSSRFSSAASTSVGVQTPGKTGMSCSWQKSTTRGFIPGETMKRAPA